MKRLRLLSVLLAAVAVQANAQIAVFDAMIFGYTNYANDTTYGFPAGLVFSDPHSGFVAGFLDAQGAPIHAWCDLGPTDESTETNTETRVNFDLLTDSPLRLATEASDSVTCSWLLRDPNFTVIASYDGWGTHSEDVPLAAGSYTIEFFVGLSFYNGHSYGNGSLHVSNLATAINPNSYLVTSGSEFSGSLSSLFASDDDRLCIFPSETTLVGEIEFSGTSSVLTPSELDFILEGMVARPGLSQTISMRNYTSGVDVVVDGRVASLEDSSVEVVLTSNASQFVGPSGALWSRVSWTPINDEEPAQDGWLQCADVARWRVVQ